MAMKQVVPVGSIKPRRAAGSILVVLAMLICSTSMARQIRAQVRVRPGSGPGMVALPYNVTDTQGNQWMIYQGGWLQQRGNTPIYSQSAMLQINNNGPNVANNQARLDDKSGELVFENMNANNVVMVTRRILVNTQEGYVRYIDVLKNSQPQEQSIAYQVQTNLNYGINSANNINEPGGKQRQIGWAATTQAGRAAIELYAGKGAKIVPTLNWQAGNNFIQATLQLTIPAGKEVAVMHFHTTAASAEAGAQSIMAIKESKLFEGVPTDLRKIIVNFTGGGGYIGDREILRGDVLDVIELRNGAGTGGDQLKGTLKDATLKLTTFYGEVTLSADKVIAMLNVGQYRPRQLLVTTDGEIFGGNLDKDAIQLQLSSGQITQVPLSQISRIGWRKHPGETEDADAPPTDKPILALRSGDRVAVEVPDKPIDVMTRYGLLKLDPKSLASVTFAAEDSNVHEITLTDGSRFAGLVAGDSFEFKLAGGAGGQTVRFPASSLARLQLTTKVAEPDDATPTINLSNADLMVGALVGQLKLDTAFDTITLDAPQVRSLTRAKDAGLDVQIELWDQTRLSGQLQQPQVTCALTSGVQIALPVPLIEKYSQPQPTPAGAMVEQIKSVVQQLGADDWKQREQAEAQLVSMGQGVVGVLKQLRPTVGPEAQQRIDSVIRQLEIRKGKPIPAGAAVPVNE